MSSPNAPTPATPVQGAPAANQAAAADAAGASPTGEVTTMTTIGSLADLRQKSPKVYNAMMQGVAMNICNEMKHHEDEREKIIKDYERR